MGVPNNPAPGHSGEPDAGRDNAHPGDPREARAYPADLSPVSSSRQFHRVGRRRRQRDYPSHFQTSNAVCLCVNARTRRYPVHSQDGSKRLNKDGHRDEVSTGQRATSRTASIRLGRPPAGWI